ncbi:MAG: Hsp70 family protein [Spirochaetales bacterium]|jgi:hypothetical protein|nr:Hsp70 family protein [Spirochaetales bacterium]
MIGIKIADGTYIPILDEFEKERRKVILTTVRDDQPSVQIDLYRGSGSGMEDPRYLDTLKIDELGEALKGEPEIELVLGLDEDGKLIATARDLAGGTEKTFSVSLDSTESEPFSYNSEPDFDISSTDMDAGSGGEEPVTPSYSPMNGHSAVIHEEKNRKPLLVAAIVALLIAAGVLCWFFLLRDQNGETVAAAQPASPPPAATPVQPVQPVTPPPPKPVTPPPAPAAQPQPAKPAPTPPPATAKSSGTGVWYSIVRGDNLWNLSKSFYRNPWLYPKIAKENDIRNTDLIYRGNRIYIPDVETDRKRK